MNKAMSMHSALLQLMVTGTFDACHAHIRPPQLIDVTTVRDLPAQIALPVTPLVRTALPAGHRLNWTWRQPGAPWAAAPNQGARVCAAQSWKAAALPRT